MVDGHGLRDMVRRSLSLSPRNFNESPRNDRVSGADRPTSLLRKGLNLFDSPRRSVKSESPKSERRRTEAGPLSSLGKTSHGLHLRRSLSPSQRASSMAHEDESVDSRNSRPDSIRNGVRSNSSSRPSSINALAGDDAKREASIGAILGEMPDLIEILEDTAGEPFSLASFQAFGREQSLDESIDFWIEIRQFQAKAGTSNSPTGKSTPPPSPKTTTEADIYCADVSRILSVYLRPGSEREINLGAAVRSRTLKKVMDALPVAKAMRSPKAGDDVEVSPLPEEEWMVVLLKQEASAGSPAHSPKERKKSNPTTPSAGGTPTDGLSPTSSTAAGNTDDTDSDEEDSPKNNNHTISTTAGEDRPGAPERQLSVREKAQLVEQRHAKAQLHHRMQTHIPKSGVPLTSSPPKWQQGTSKSPEGASSSPVRAIGHVSQKSFAPKKNNFFFPTTDDMESENWRRSLSAITLDRTVFSSAQASIFDLLLRDAYPRYIDVQCRHLEAFLGGKTQDVEGARVVKLLVDREKRRLRERLQAGKDYSAGHSKVTVMSPTGNSIEVLM